MLVDYPTLFPRSSASPTLGVDLCLLSYPCLTNCKYSLLRLRLEFLLNYHKCPRLILTGVLKQLTSKAVTKRIRVLAMAHQISQSKYFYRSYKKCKYEKDEYFILDTCSGKIFFYIAPPSIKNVFKVPL